MSIAVHETSVPSKGLKGGSLGLVAVIVIGVSKSFRIIVVSDAAIDVLHQAAALTRETSDTIRTAATWK